MFFLKSPPRRFTSLADRGPLNVMFLLSSMPVGGAEVLLANLVRRMSARFHPQICCLKQPGELGEELAKEVPFFSGLIRHKYDAGVIGRLRDLFVRQSIDAIVTVGAGDKMFWGRLAANRARVPVILSALHSTGWPDGVGRLNRLLTPITDGFIAVAPSHGRFLTEFEKFPADKVTVIPNGVDVQRFDPSLYDRPSIRRALNIDDSNPVVGIVAALRPEKNHRLFLEAAARVVKELPAARFLIVGDGPERPDLESVTDQAGLRSHVIFTGSRSDIPELLSAIDLFALTSRNEASPVSVMEAMSMQRPVVAPDVGSIADTVAHEQTGYLFSTAEPETLADYWLRLLREPRLRAAMGQAGRATIERQASLEVMVDGYERLIESLYERKISGSGSRPAEVATARDVIEPAVAGKGEVTC